MTAMALKPTRRVRAVREALEILKLAGRGEPINYEGEIFTVRRYHPSWATSTPPVIYAGANRDKMQRMAARYADGIMLSDKIIPQVREARAVIDPVLDAARPGSARQFRLNNFWAWHVKESREEAEREARIWLALRGVLLRRNHHYFMNDADMDLVEEKRGAFFDALRRRSPDIEGVPERIVAPAGGKPDLLRGASAISTRKSSDCASSRRPGLRRSHCVSTRHRKQR